MVTDGSNAADGEVRAPQLEDTLEERLDRVRSGHIANNMVIFYSLLFSLSGD